MDFKKYTKIYYLGHKDNTCLKLEPNQTIHVEEKIDGGNFRFYITKDGKIIFGSRTQQLTSNEGDDTNIPKDFLRCANYIRDKLKDKNLNVLHGFIFYGESCHKHTITYNFECMPPYLGFDIYNTDKYLDYEEKKLIFNYLGLEMVPYLGILNIDLQGDINKQIEALVPVSKYALESAQDRLAEGIVFKNYENQTMAKYVRDKFKEKNAEMFGGNPKYNKVDDTDNAEFIFKYCTNPRIEKVIFKLIDEGNELHMKLMALLPKQIYIDIWDENWQEIRDSNWKLDMKQLRKQIPVRCRNVLGQMLVNNSLK